ALFEGPSGTGKPMAAEILAGDVGMALYRIDLSSIVSKYIGETEENLEEIFTAAENSNAVLLFDEADAVFGDRAEVSDATDRYANAEVNYLLQRIENYDGVVLLTTNYASAIDSAFQRRLDHTVSFKQPQRETRRAIWEGIFPEATPLGEIDYDFLASFEFTGGEIKGICQTAAVLAAEDATGETAGDRRPDTTGGRIEMRHLVGAIQLAFETSGRMVDPSAYEPYGHLRYDPASEALLAAESAGSHDPNGPHADHDGTADRGSDDTDDTDNMDKTNGGRTVSTDHRPEDVVRRLFERLRRGEGVADLYHPRAIVEPPSPKARRRLAHGEASITGEIDRLRDESDRVVLGVVRTVDGTDTEVTYELWPDDGTCRSRRWLGSETYRPESGDDTTLSD
ncbi:MAG: ATP-binding protein, partial [Halohasta sp.]